MEHRFNRKQCHTELATFIVQRSINGLASCYGNHAIDRRECLLLLQDFIPPDALSCVGSDAAEDCRQRARSTVLRFVCERRDAVR